MQNSKIVSFDFYGLIISVKSDDEILMDINLDFSYFRAEFSRQGVILDVIRQSGPRSSLPRLKSSIHTPRNIVFRGSETSYIDYFGRALMVQQDRMRRFTIYCEDRDLAHEIAYLTILSLVGQHLDDHALHRIHALGIEAGKKAVLILLPLAGGKTTLALNLLREEGIKLLSEDSPLMSRKGTVLPFPIRLGVRVGGKLPDVLPEQMRTVKRMEFGPKILIDIKHFREKIADPCPAGIILLGERWLTGPSNIYPANRSSALGFFIKNCVVGLGLYQGIEFLLERTAWELWGRAGVALSRLRNSVKVIRRSKVYRFVMGPNEDESAKVLIDFLRDLPFPDQ